MLIIRTAIIQMKHKYTICNDVITLAARQGRFVTAKMTSLLSLQGRGLVVQTPANISRRLHLHLDSFPGLPSFKIFLKYSIEVFCYSFLSVLCIVYLLTAEELDILH